MGQMRLQDGGTGQPMQNCGSLVLKSLTLQPVQFRGVRGWPGSWNIIAEAPERADDSWTDRNKHSGGNKLS